LLLSGKNSIILKLLIIKLNIMKIKALFHGILADWVGQGEAEFTLPREATLADLLLEIRKNYGSNMPPHLAMKDQEDFNQAFWAVRGTEQFKEPNEKLLDGEEVRFFLPLSGG
jgi:molybdopterin converting factor small subunit